MATTTDPTPGAEAQSAFAGEPTPGDLFAGRYRIVQELGHGDRKRTYLAEDIELGRHVALALVKPESAREDPEGTAREARMLAQAGNHDNIVTLYDQGVANGIEYLVFDYLAGGTLKTYLAEQRAQDVAVSADEAMRLGRNLARALAHLHNQGVIHRDVAPANVWLDERRMAHLGDFDSAVRRDARQDLSTLPPTTEAYAAPEQAHGRYVDIRSDLYSLGAVLYEVVTGERPSEASGQVDVRLAALRPDLPPSVRMIIRRLLAESPGDRPAHADEVVRAMKPPHVIRSKNRGILAWAEDLPFPLATILWHYDGEPESRAKVEFLLRFFEALAQFRAAVMLSACLSDHEFFASVRAHWFGTVADEPQERLELRVATFGTWVELSARIAKTLRSLLHDPHGGREQCRELFAASDTELIEALVSRDLGSVLDEAMQRRNSWTGHGGHASDHIQDARLRELQELLDRTTELIAWSFETWTLIRPGAMTFSRGDFDVTASLLRGANPIFRRARVKLNHPPEETSLYLLSDGQCRALQLAPLLRVRTGASGQEACYFYNRLTGSAVRWISHHFAPEPDVVADDPEVIRLLDLASPDQPVLAASQAIKREA